MDFQENRQTEVPADNAQPAENNNGPSYPNGRPQESSNGFPYSNGQPQESSNGSPYQNGQPYENSNGSPYQGQPYENSNGSPYQNGRPYGNGSGSPYQNGQPYQGRPPYGNGTPYPAPQQPYGNNANAPGQNNNPYQSNTPYGNQYPNGNCYQGGYTPNANNYNPNRYNQNNGYNNNHPYYNRNTYRLPVAEPGSSLANAAMICGILSIVFCFTFTVYPAFMLGSISIILALLSKGRRSNLFSKARTGIICATIGLILNTVIITSSVMYVFTNPEQMEKFNEQWEQIYGESFDDMMDDIMGNHDHID